MRRIFGGTPVAGSASKELTPSDGISPPPITPTDLSFRSNSIDSEDRPSINSKKGWFESALDGVSGTLVGRSPSQQLQRNDSSTSQGTLPAISSPSKVGRKGDLEEEDIEYAKLPFGSSRMRSPPPSGLDQHFLLRSPPQRVGANGGHAREASLQSDGKKRVSMMSGASIDSDRETLMSELLSGQAIIEVKDYQILEWDEMQEIKKEHTVLASRIASLSRSLALETKMRDAASKLVRLAAPASAVTTSTSSSGAPSSSSTRPRATKEQAEAQLATASAKVAGLSNELYRVGWKEARLRTQLLQHTAAVLAVAARKSEAFERGATPSPLPPTSPPPNSNSKSKHGVISERNTPSPSRDLPPQARFDGPHFFAGNREALSPSALHQRLGSPYASPQLSAPLNGAFPTQDARELEVQVADLKLAVEGKQKSEQDLKRRLQEANQEMDDLRGEAEYARSALEGMRSELDEVTAQLDAARMGAELLKEDPGAAGAKTALEDAQKSLAAREREKEDAERRAASAEVRVGTLEADLNAAKKGLEVERLRYEELESDSEAKAGLGLNLDALLRGPSDSVDEKRRLVESVGDVLRRHRTRAALGPILRDVASFDDSIPEKGDSTAAATYVSTALDNHFEALSRHVVSLTDQRVATRSRLDKMESELQQSSAQRDQFRGEAESLRQAMASLETARRELQSQVDSHQEQLGGSAEIEEQLASTRASESRLKEELALHQLQLAAAEAKPAEAGTLQGKSLKDLQDLWRSIPPLESRLAARSSSDLSVLKTAFETPRRPLGNFLADVTGAKFTVDALVERIRTLLAEDVKLVQKLVTFETAKESDRVEVERVTKALAESSASLQANQAEIKELQLRIDVSTQQEVTMLERLNDLTESLESARAERRKLDSTLATTQTQLQSLESEKGTLTSALAAAREDLKNASDAPNDSERVVELETTVSDLQDSLADLEAELSDAKARAQKQRTQLLDQLSEAEQEASSLKTQLRQEQRKKSKV